MDHPGPTRRRAAAAALPLLLLLSTLATAGCLGGPDGAPPGPPDGLANEAPPGIALEHVVDGLESPVYVTQAPGDDQHLFVVEQAGRVRVADLATGDLRAAPFLDVRERVGSEGNEQGLLSLAFAPDFQESRRFYVYYTGTDGDSVVARYRVSADDPLRAEAGSRETILRVTQPYANHNGGLLLFGPDGMLYVGLGDGGAGGDPHNNAQDRRSLLGSILRLDVSGAQGYAVPEDNPYAGHPEFRGEIWDFGLRNPWRFSFDRQTGDLYIGDVGQGSREEVDFEPAGSDGGRNYGWNVWEGSERFRPGEAVTEPVFPVTEYARDGPHCAVTGGYVYRGDALPALRGVYLFADYCSGTIWGLTADGGEWSKTVLLESDLRITSFGEDNRGAVYVVDRGGDVWRVAGTEAQPD